LLVAYCYYPPESPSLPLASIKPRILPFKVWKQKKVDEAKAVVMELKHDHKKQTQVKLPDDGTDEVQDEAQKLSKPN